MAKEKLEIEITAKDNASRAIGDVNTSLARLGDIGFNMLQGGVTMALGAAAAGAAGLAAGLTLAVVEGMEAQDIMAQLDAVLKSTAGTSGMTSEAIVGIADALTKVTKYTDDEIISAETLLLQFRSIGQDAFPQATATALDLATAMNTDLSTAARMLGKALETPGEGLLRLKAAGVAFDDEQIKMLQNLADTGKMAEAQTIIMDELAKSVGGRAAAAGQTMTGQWVIMRNMLSDTAEEVGTAIIPALTEAFNSVKPYIMELAKAIADFVQSDEFKQWVKDVIQFLKESKPFLQDTWQLFKDIAHVLGVILPPAIAAFNTAYQIFYIAIFTALAPVRALIDAFQFWAKAIAVVKDSLSDLKLPDWLTPGSPTPLELGLRGINNALGQVSMSGLTFAGPQASMSGAGGGSVSKSVIVNINAPVLGFADEYDLGRKLGPIIREQLRGT